MAKIKLEYLWLDGYTPVPNLRGKTCIKEGDVDKWSLEDCPMWGFDGSSTQQAEGNSSLFVGLEISLKRRHWHAFCLQYNPAVYG